MSITLINGDALTDTREFTGKDYIFVSDPPYNVGYHYATYKDKMPEGDYYSWLADIFSAEKKVLIHYHENLYKFAFQIGEFPEKIVSWVYNANTPRQHRGIAFFGVKPDFSQMGQPYKNPKDKRIAKRIKEGKQARLYDWWNVEQVKNVSAEKTEHPAQIPLLIMERIIGILPKDAVIVDPFMGSGTTGAACVRLGRDFIGVESDELYFDIAKKRIAAEQPHARQASAKVCSNVAGFFIGDEMRDLTQEEYEALRKWHHVGKMSDPVLDKLFWEILRQSPIPETESELVAKLRVLADAMATVATDMSLFGGEYVEHGAELSGAADMIEQWILHLENSGGTV